jgi:disulfide bond formation protein DsbB
MAHARAAPDPAASRLMSVDTVELFYAILAILAVAFVAVVLVVRLLALASSSARGWYEAIGGVLEPNAVGMAFVVAMLATIGSLYFSEIAHFDPCRLCWYQRIAMYPLVVILGIAAVRRDAGAGIYVRALAAIGALISTYHVALEWIPALDTGACGVGPSCTVIWFRALGFISLPTLALAAFLLIFTLLSVRGPGAVDGDPDVEPDPDRSPA